MNKLIINSANDKLFIVLAKGNDKFFCTSDSKMHHNETVLPLIDKMLKDNNLEVVDIDKFGVCVGPGSFTGIRVGISMVKALRDATKKSARGFNNLQYLYDLAKLKDESVKVVAIKGSRDSYFVARELLNTLYIYERNLSLEEVKNLSCGGKVGMFSADDDLNCLVVEDDADIMVSLVDKSEDESLVPIYYQLSQAENDKLKKGDIEIALAQNDEIKDVVNIENETELSNKLTEDNFLSYLNHPDYRLFVSKFNGEVVGFVLIQITDEINIDHIAVRKEFRNIGIATRLIKEIEIFSKTKDINTLNLEVSDKNLTAYLLYEKLGFKSRRIRKNYYKDSSNCIEMEKKLN